MGRFAFPAALAVVFLPASSAVACPLCRSDTGQQVRDGIFNNEFGGNLLAMILPFLVITVVAGLIHGGAPRPRTKPSRDDRTGDRIDRTP